MIVDGKKIASEILAKLKSEPFGKLRARKFLAAFLVGDDPASASFLKQKEKTAKELGVDFRLYKFPIDVKNDDLRAEVRKVAEHKTCGGVIVQLPLPEHVNEQYVLNVIPREKDIDVLGERALGAFYAGRNPVLPPAVGAVDEILSTRNVQLESSRVAVVGRGMLVGKPIALWLMDKVRELIVLGHSADLSILKDVDIVISGVGKAGVIRPDMLKPEAGVIDFGYDVSKSQSATGKPSIRGDFDSEQLAADDSRLAFYTPTPGGTGPLLVAKLFQNFYTLNTQ